MIGTHSVPYAHPGQWRQSDQLPPSLPQAPVSPARPINDDAARPWRRRDQMFSARRCARLSDDVHRDRASRYLGLRIIRGPAPETQLIVDVRMLGRCRAVQHRRQCRRPPVRTPVLTARRRWHCRQGNNRNKDHQRPAKMPSWILTEMAASAAPGAQWRKLSIHAK